MGGPGTGKSNNLLAVARRISGHVHVIDNDNAYDRMLETDFSGLENVDVYPSWGWDATFANAKKICEQMERDDWLAVDILSPTWQMVQDWFSENVYGDDLATYMLRARQTIQTYNDAQKSKKDEVKSLQPFDGYLDWSVINPQYAKFMAMLRNCPGHVYCTAEVDAVDSKRDDAQVQGLYGAYGVKPRGQKRTGHQFSTILMLLKRKVGEWEMTTIKDRGRREVEGEKVGDFALSYLVRIAGWRPAKGN